MKKPLFRIMTRFVVLCALLAALCGITLFGNVPVRALSYFGYFDDFYACSDNSYNGTLGGCRNTPGYPSTPTESQCRYNAADAFIGCLNALDYPSIEPDLCDAARAARDYCLIQYPFSGGFENTAARMECVSASGINQCE